MKKIYLSSLIILLFSTDLNAQQIIVGTGTGPSLYTPISRRADYSVCETIYNSSDIGISGVISHLAFERLDGTDEADIDSVTIYMKQSGQTMLVDTAFSTANYQQVYFGKFPNAGTGWQEVALDVPFNYSNTSNLMVLVLKGYQPAVANTPVAVRWLYGTVSSNQSRRYYGPVPITASTTLTGINFTANVRLTFGSVGVAEIRGDQLQVFPNPANDYLTVTMPTQETSVLISLYDLQGRLVISKISEAASGRMSEDVSLQSLAPGVYNLTVQAGFKIYRERLVVVQD
jgi:hypothetical protein